MIDTTRLYDFEPFLTQREDAARAYVCGDAAPLGRLAARVHPATFFPPRGGHREGTSDVAATLRRGTPPSFDRRVKLYFDILAHAAGDSVAYWTGFQRAKVQMQGSSEPVEMNLRVTEVFRREGGNWKMVHRARRSIDDRKPAAADRMIPARLRVGLDPDRRLRSGSRDAGSRSGRPASPSAPNGAETR